MAESGDNGKLARIKGLVPLNTIVDDALQRLVGQMRFDVLKRGDYLFKIGDEKQEHVYLLEGQVVYLQGGKDVDVIEAGGATTKFPLDHHFPRRYDARAKSKVVEVVRFPSQLIADHLPKGSQDGPAYEVSDIGSEGGDDWMSQLLHSPVFQHLPAASIQGVMMHMKEREVAKDEVIINEGDAGETFFFINKGRCKVERKDRKTGNLVKMADLGPGGTFGEDALLSGALRNATITMLTPGVLLELSKEDFIQFIKTPLANAIHFAAAEQQVKAGAKWLDVRSPQKYRESGLLGAINMPFQALRLKIASLDPQQNYVAYCDDGRIAVAAAYVLIQNGIEAVYLDGGLARAGKLAPIEAVAGEPQDTEEVEAMRERLAKANEVSREYANRMKMLKEALEKSKTRMREMEDAKQRQSAAEVDELKTALEARAQELEQAKGVEEQSRQMEQRMRELQEQLEQAQRAAQETAEERERASRELQESIRRQQEDFERERGVLREQLSEARGQLDQLEGELAAREQAGREQERLRQEAEKRLSTVEQQLNSVDREREEAARKASALNQEQERARGELETAQERLNALQMALEERERADREREVQYAGAVSKLQQDLETMNAERDAAQGRIAALEAEHTRYRQAVEEAKSKAAMLEVEIGERERLQARVEEEQRQAMAQLEGELRRIREEREEAQRRIDALAAEQAATRQALEHSGDEIRKLEEAIQAKTSAPGDEAERQAVEQMQRELAALQSERENAQQRIASLEGERSLTQGALEASVSRLEGLEDEKSQRAEAESRREAEQREAMERLAHELEAIRQERDQAQQRISTLQQEQESSDSKLTDAGSKVEELSQQIQSLNLEFERQRQEQGETEGSEERDRMRQQMEELRRSLETKQDSLRQSEEDKKRLEAFIAERKQKMEGLKGALSDAQAGVAEAEARRQEAEAARLEVEESLKRLQDEVARQEKRPSFAAVEVQVEARTFSVRAMVIGVLVGVTAVFAVVDAYMTIAGKGEIISTLFAELTKERKPLELVPILPMPGGPSGTETGTDGVSTPLVPMLPVPVVAPPVEVALPPPPQVPVPEERDRSAEPANGTVLRDGMKAGPAPEMVYVRGGSFPMGNKPLLMTTDENPQHQVRVESFYIGRYEVTFREFDAFARATGRPLPPDQGWGRESRPVVNVTWADAVAYTEWLSKETGRSYRLPSEAQWEYAARGGSPDSFWWGAMQGFNLANCFDCGSQWDNSQTAPVGQFAANGYGLFDTAGNAMEWVEDCYHENYRNAPEDGSAWVTGKCGTRVVRGGAYSRPADSMRITKRGNFDPKGRTPYLGFRVVRVP